MIEICRTANAYPNHIYNGHLTKRCDEEIFPKARCTNFVKLSATHRRRHISSMQLFALDTLWVAFFVLNTK